MHHFLCSLCHVKGKAGIWFFPEILVINKLLITRSVVSTFKEDICLKTQKTPYFGAALQKYATSLIVTNKCIPLNLPSNPNYVLKPMHSHHTRMYFVKPCPKDEKYCVLKYMYSLVKVGQYFKKEHVNCIFKIESKLPASCMFLG
jgi:hypothetical protein